MHNSGHRLLLMFVLPCVLTSLGWGWTCLGRLCPQSLRQLGICSQEPSSALGVSLMLTTICKVGVLAQEAREALIARTVRWRREVGALAERIIQVLDLADLLDPQPLPESASGSSPHSSA